MYGCMDGCVDVRKYDIDVCMDGWMDAWMHACMNV